MSNDDPVTIGFRRGWRPAAEIATPGHRWITGRFDAEHRARGRRGRRRVPDPAQHHRRQRRSELGDRRRHRRGCDHRHVARPDADHHGHDAAATTTIPPLVTEGATVVVANASGVPGSAGRMSTTLATVGFTMAEATNATTQLEVSIVYYDPAVVAAQAVADSVARTMGGLEVAPVPTPVPIDGAALNGSGVVVMLGTAQADKTVEEMAAPTTAATPATGTAPAVAGTETTTTTVAG